MNTISLYVAPTKPVRRFRRYLAHALIYVAAAFSNLVHSQDVTPPDDKAVRRRV